MPGRGVRRPTVAQVERQRLGDGRQQRQREGDAGLRPHDPERGGHSSRRHRTAGGSPRRPRGRRYSSSAGARGRAAPVPWRCPPPAAGAARPPRATRGAAARTSAGPARSRTRPGLRICAPWRAGSGRRNGRCRRYRPRWHVHIAARTAPGTRRCPSAPSCSRSCRGRRDEPRACRHGPASYRWSPEDCPDNGRGARHTPAEAPIRAAWQASRPAMPAGKAPSPDRRG